MADILKLKKKAADFEAKKQPDKALATYREMIEVYERGDEDPIDIPLYNRVGDLLQKAGNLPEAVSVWERAVDHYTDGGFYNPAIALCNKILRQSPGRAIVYYKLGKISAEKGFKADARQNFLEYASRMQQAGNLDEAFRALKEFADLVPDQDDVRIMLADQLVKANRKEEAIEQLQIAYAQLVREGRDGEADTIVGKMKAIDPTVEPRADEGGGGSKGGGLVFLEVEPTSGPGGRKSRASRTGLTPGETKRATKAVEGLELLDPGLPVEEKRPAAAAPAPPPAPKAPAAPPPRVSAPTPAAAPPRVAVPTPAAAKAAPPPPPPPPPVVEAPVEIPMIDLEPTSLVEETKAPEVELPMLDEPPAAPPRRATVESGLSDFDSFGAPGENALVTEEPGFAPMEVVSSEGVHSLPMGEAAFEPVVEAEPSFGDLEFVAPEEPVIPRESSTVLAISVDSLKDQVSEAPEDWGLRRHLAEALLDDGQKDEGIAELEVALAGFEHSGDLDTAASIAEEIVRLAPTVIKYHQKRVEFAFRANDRPRLAEAYVELADALVRDGQGPKARVVYQRVLEIQPDDIRAQAALETLVEAPVPAPAPAPRRSTAAATRKSVAASAPAKPAAAPKKKVEEEEFVSLGDWLREDDEPKSTRMVVEEKEPTGDEQADFQDMLRKFKQGVSDNVAEEDHEAHYDLGVAFKEMGLLDEAISEFQKALRGTANRVRALEALGLCFVEKQQLPVAATILQRALGEAGVRDDALIGVLYLLGTISEELALYPDAKKYYERVFAVDIQFRDIGDRLNAVEKKLK